MQILGTTIAPGESQVLTLNIANLPSRTPIDIPIQVYRAKKEGPTVLFLAGMHGDEAGGIEIIRRLIVQKYFKKLTRGTVIAIPILNVYGFINFSRAVPDGKDVNRSFPGNRAGSLASRVTWHFVHKILPKVDHIMDFHTGGASRSNFPQVRCVLDGKENDLLAKAIGAPFVINSPLRDKSLRWYATKMGKRVMVYEAGESLRFSEHAITEGVNGALRFLKHFGMIRQAPAPNEVVVLQRSGWIRAKVAGLFHPLVESGVFCRKGTVLGLLHGPFGDFTQKIRAREGGYIIAVNHMPVVNQGDALFHIGYTDKVARKKS